MALNRKKETPENAVITVPMPRGEDVSLSKNPTPQHQALHILTQEALLTAVGMVHGV